MSVYDGERDIYYYGDGARRWRERDVFEEREACWLANGDSEKGKDCAPWGTRGK